MNKIEGKYNPVFLAADFDVIDDLSSKSSDHIESQPSLFVGDIATESSIP